MMLDVAIPYAGGEKRLKITIQSWQLSELTGPILDAETLSVVADEYEERGDYIPAAIVREAAKVDPVKLRAIFAGDRRQSEPKKIRPEFDDRPGPWI